ncbi:two-component sensor histidine kinase [Thioclava sp. SK-1]|uniref:ATP-binding protein n=1 Tax=Thioclava sp. SK-1 TaxID=1889770 RepID=UPI00082448B5|nr:ATP-binding protein [Thioclava sp. SK-1]OCX62273.1 two-component sensor histidine kinase [Thioclava sp. SK-1]
MTLSATISILQAVPSPILIIDPDERVVQCNGAARTLFGGDVTGRAFVTVLRQPAIGLILEAALVQNRSDQSEVRIAPGKREMIAMITATPLAPEPGGLVPKGGALLSFQDVTDQREAEAIRRDFVANVSHELRTPLTALSGFIETLRGAARDDPKARDRFLAIMEREAQRMNRLVDDLLSLSRVESEERRRPTEKIDLSAVLKGAMQALSPVAQAQKVELLREGKQGTLPVVGDPDQLTQVFTNLIENGIKYGGAGGVLRLRVDPIDREPVLGGAAWRVTVEDEGDGIDEIHLPRLTERFYRVDTHRSREQGGTGLGLAIVKHIISRHRGRMRVESKKGEGTRFIILLPVA